MIIFPAIDIKGGKCVRLTQGDYGKEEIYGDPVEMAKQWMNKGAETLHIVDLDGALEGESKNLHVIKEIVKNVSIPVQVGGGIRSIQAIETLVKAGVTRTIIGTSAVNNKAFVQEAVLTFGPAIAVSIDAKNGYVATEGWTKISEKKALDFAKELTSVGVETIIYTDIAKDGMLSGPNFSEIKLIDDEIKANVIASGGVTTKEDIDKLKDLNVYGAIVGKALYTGAIELEEILKDV
jgi:phosphoribosylformimino-5-aminoimidazole carboxamide ribotide isomerase